MANLSNVIKILQNDYDTIVSAYPNSATISTGVTITYDPNSLYLVESDNSNSKKYLHNIQIIYSNTYIATFSFINSKSNSYGNGTNTNWPTLIADLNSAGFNSANNTCPAQGQFYASGKTNLVTGVYYATSGVIGFKGLTIMSTSGTTMTVNESAVTTTGTLGASATIYDVVTEL